MVLLNYLADGTHFCGANHTYEIFVVVVVVYREKLERMCRVKKMFRPGYTRRTIR